MGIERDFKDLWEEIRKTNDYLEKIYYERQLTEAEKTPPVAQFRSVTVNSVSQQVLSSNTFRHEVNVINNGPDTVFIAATDQDLDGVSGVTSFVSAISLTNGASIRLRYAGRLCAVAPSGTASVSMVETIFERKITPEHNKYAFHENYDVEVKL